MNKGMTFHNRFLSYLIVIFYLMMLNSCDGFHVSANGDLDGMWHIVEVDSLVEEKQVDYTYEGLYWSVQSDLLFVDDKLQRYLPCLFRFRHDGENLIVNAPHYYNLEDVEEKITDVGVYSPYGINSDEESFIVEQLTGKSMILRSKLLRLKFKRY